MIARLAPCLLLLAASPAAAQVCEQARLDLPEPIADAMRPYVVCSLFSTGERSKLFGATYSEASDAPVPGLAACGTIREKAALEADEDLQATMPDRAARAQYIEAALRDVDRFIAASRSSSSIAIDPAEKKAACGTDETRTPNAADQ